MEKGQESWMVVYVRRVTSLKNSNRVWRRCPTNQKKRTCHVIDVGLSVLTLAEKDRTILTSVEKVSSTAAILPVCERVEFRMIWANFGVVCKFKGCFKRRCGLRCGCSGLVRSMFVKKVRDCQVLSDYSRDHCAVVPTEDGEWWSQSEFMMAECWLFAVFCDGNMCLVRCIDSRTSQNCRRLPRFSRFSCWLELRSAEEV